MCYVPARVYVHHVGTGQRPKEDDGPWHLMLAFPAGALNTQPGAMRQPHCVLFGSIFFSTGL